MKIRFDIEVTPQELRTFFGLPDVQSLQDEIMSRITENMRTGMEGFDPLSLMKPLLPAHLQSMEMIQRLFWNALAQQGEKTQDKD
jgi:hypothetical protein